MVLVEEVLEDYVLIYQELLMDLLLDLTLR
jgi:hypothetical protein